MLRPFVVEVNWMDEVVYLRADISLKIENQ